MSMATAHPEVSSYLSALRAHLEDLPEGERQDLLEDLEQHLAEVAAEGEGSLVDRLGPPDLYAAELRSSVGLPPDGGRGLGERLLEGARRSSIGRMARGVAATSAYGGIRSFVTELRPGWWVLRGYVAVVGLILILAPDHQYLSDIPIPIPWLLGSQAWGLAAIAAGIWASVALGREATNRMRARVISFVVSLIVAGIGFDLIPRVQERLAMAAAATYEEPEAFGPGFLQHQDGTPIANICPYGADGRRLEGVLIFDQDGRPITEVAPVTAPEHQEVERTLPKGVDGQRIANAYPHRVMAGNPETGELEPLPCPSVLVPPQKPPDAAEQPVVLEPSPPTED